MSSSTCVISTGRPTWRRTAFITLASGAPQHLLRPPSFPRTCQRVQHLGHRAIEFPRIAILLHAPQSARPDARPKLPVLMEPHTLCREVVGRTCDERLLLVPPSKLSGQKRRHHGRYSVRCRVVHLERNACSKA